jgi:hypothetical protein
MSSTIQTQVLTTPLEAGQTGSGAGTAAKDRKERKKQPRRLGAERGDTGRGDRLFR